MTRAKAKSNFWGLSRRFSQTSKHQLQLLQCHLNCERQIQGWHAPPRHYILSSYFWYEDGGITTWPLCIFKEFCGDHSLKKVVIFTNMCAWKPVNDNCKTATDISIRYWPRVPPSVVTIMHSSPLTLPVAPPLLISRRKQSRIGNHFPRRVQVFPCILSCWAGGKIPNLDSVTEKIDVLQAWNRMNSWVRITTLLRRCYGKDDHQDKTAF